MSAAQRVSRGFHRLGFFLAGIPLLLGAIFSLYVAWVSASDAKLSHGEQVRLVCAQDVFHKKFYADFSQEEFDRRVAEKLAHIESGEVKVTDPDLKELGCSDQSRTVSVLEIFRAHAPGKFSWSAVFWPPLGYGLAISLGVASPSMA